MSKNTVVYKELATYADHIRRIKGKDNMAKYLQRSQEIMGYILSDLLPHGNGFDCDLTVDYDKCNVTRIVIYGSFHCMDWYGGYDGWVDYSVTVRPTLTGDGIVVKAKSRNNTSHLAKKYDTLGHVEDCFYAALVEEVQPMRELF